VAVAGTEIAGQAMYVRDPRDGREAEVAAVVEDRHQSGGVGRLLLSEIAAEARRGSNADLYHAGGQLPPPVHREPALSRQPHLVRGR
jgi:GNAT superfamily N-acetyltransferase